MSRLENKVAVITGGGTGIGKATAEAFVAEGARVVITGRREDPLKAVADAHPDAVAYITADVTKPEDPQRIVDFAVERFGGIDVVVNNAAVFFMKPLVETTPEEVQQMFTVNVGGPVGLTRAALPSLLERKGNVINVSSVVGAAAMPGNSIYGSSKAAVDWLTRNLAAELGPAGVRVNAVAPGLTETDMAAPITSHDESRDQMVGMTALGRLGQPDDIARTIVFVASDEWITGQVIASSGGLLI